ncbi:globin domain-containing protein [Gordonia sp. NPDC058843]|uniref:globin domain-containing protein n=1 Tax=Gordonia sp. NPDC058843 TaxID=3346648 RepID=UPI0036AF1B81
MDKQLLHHSFGLVDLPNAGLTVRFYEILFDRYPTVRAMFGRGTRVQAETLRSAIVSVVDHVDDAEWLTTTLHALGRRHARLGVTRPMYCAVAECMIAAMSEIGGDAWTPAMTQAWDRALGAVATIMLDGYPEESTTPARGRRRGAGAA